MIGGTGAVSVAGLAGCSGQESYPSEDINVVVPWAAGGGTDQATRKLVEVINSEDMIDTDVFVSNVSGATGSNGMSQVANADPDGYTVAAETWEIVVLDNLGISDLKPEDLQSVMQFVFLATAFNTRDEAEYSTLEEFVEYASNNEVNVAHAGTGGVWHIAIAGFAQEVGIDLGYIPYDGGAPAVEALLNGEVEAAVAAPPEVSQQVQNGPLNCLGVMGEERAAPLPDTPTFIEQGYDWTWGTTFSLAVPPETEEERIGTLHDAGKEAFETDEYQTFLTESGFQPTYRSGEEYMQFKQSQYEDVESILDDLGMLEG
jgi:tripartite-type tricarboxylate transporter receptor subunit TctC